MFRNKDAADQVVGMKEPGIHNKFSSKPISFLWLIKSEDGNSVGRQMDIKAKNGLIIDIFLPHRLYSMWILKGENE